jgi:hypothetical protein
MLSQWIDGCVSVAAHLADALQNRFLAGVFVAMASATEFGKRTLLAHWPDTYSPRAFLKLEAISRPYP